MQTFVTNANQVDIQTQNRMTLDVIHAPKDICKIFQVLRHVNYWVPMLLDWVVVLLKSKYHQDHI
tara:strand:+ start:684 stop:878 length:195 start_codon:yes stop_codon:yes gene_type:complete